MEMTIIDDHQNNTADLNQWWSSIDQTLPELWNQLRATPPDSSTDLTAETYPSDHHLAVKPEKEENDVKKTDSTPPDNDQDASGDGTDAEKLLEQRHQQLRQYVAQITWMHSRKRNQQTMMEYAAELVAIAPHAFPQHGPNIWNLMVMERSLDTIPHRYRDSLKASPEDYPSVYHIAAEEERIYSDLRRS